MLTPWTSEDAAGLAAHLDTGPRRVLVIGAGFTGSEIASACRERGIELTVAGGVWRRTAPQAGASPTRSSRSLSHTTNGIDTTIINVLPTIWPARNSNDP